MADLGVGGACAALESLGRTLVPWAPRQNLSTALLLGGALLFDRLVKFLTRLQAFE